MRPEPQPTSSRRVPGPTPAASRTASNSGRLCASARSAQAWGSVPHRRRWTSAAALIMLSVIVGSPRIADPGTERAGSRGPVSRDAVAGLRSAHRRPCMPAMTSLCWCSSTGCGNSGPPSCQATEIGPVRAVLISRQPSRSSRALSCSTSGTTQETWLIAPGATRYAAARRSSAAWTWPSSTTTGPQAAKAAEWSNTTSSRAWPPSVSTNESNGTCSMTSNGPTSRSRCHCFIAASRSSTQ